jgi:Raf kinase inhibitor-like YbhB/YbcL family protein
VKRLPLVATVMVASLSAFAAPAAAAGFALTSPAFADDAMLPADFAGPGECKGHNISPPLAWTNPPAGTKSFAIVVTDADGGSGLGSVHWVAYGIAPDVASIPPGFGGNASPAFTGGTNSRNLTTYFGPCSRPGAAPHHYIITAIALDVGPGALPPALTREAFFAAAKDHALGSSSLVVRYAR